LNYSPTIGEDDRCFSTGTTVDPVYAPLSRYGSDANEELVRSMYQRFNIKFGKVDVILISGDHVGHGISVKDGSDDPVSY
jgi:hypothetical protein